MPGSLTTKASPKPPNLAAGIENKLLRLLPPPELARFLPQFKAVQVRPKQVLVAIGQELRTVSFLESGTVSMVQTLEDGARVEVGLVGSEGFVGLSALLGEGPSFSEAMVQVEGKLLQIPAPRFLALLEDVPRLRALMLRYSGTFFSQVAQTAVCNARHHVEQRLARWLLMTHDRAGGDQFTMPQEFMSTLLGVRRPSVTVAIGALSRAGFVRQARGVLEVLDRPGLEAASCECYGMVRQRYAWLSGSSAA